MVSPIAKGALLLVAGVAAIAVAGCTPETEPNNDYNTTQTVHTLSAASFQNSSKSFDGIGTVSEKDKTDWWRFPTSSDLPAGHYTVVVAAQPGLGLFASVLGKAVNINCPLTAKNPCVQGQVVTLTPNQDPEPFMSFVRTTATQTSDQRFYLFTIVKQN